MYKAIFPLSFLLFVIASAQGQTHGPLGHPHSQQPHWRVALLLGHTFVPAVGSQYSAIPSWGVDLEYWPTAKWGIGLHNDIELQSFIIEQAGREGLLEREYPLVLTLDALFKPWRGLVLQFGPGIELERSEHFYLLRLGVEYEFEFGRHWDVAPSIFYDTRLEAFDTWAITLGVGKRF